MKKREPWEDLERRMQEDLRGIVERYQAQGWVVQSTDPLTMTRGGVEQRIEALNGEAKRV